MDAGVVISIIIAVIGIAITVVIWIASTRAVNEPKIREEAIDREAWQRAKNIYEGSIDQLENEVTRLGNQVNDCNDELMRANRENMRLRRKILSIEDDSGPQPKLQ